MILWELELLKLVIVVVLVFEELYFDQNSVMYGQFLCRLRIRDCVLIKIRRKLLYCY